MEIKTNTLNEHKIQSTGKVTNMKLDEDSQAMIFQMFTGGLYSDPIGTLIREIASNSFDSHVEAGVDSTENPVVIELKKEVSGHFISFFDKGVGMSPDRVENIYGTYFKSTKRTTNKEIGGFGLGGKTPLAYTESFYIITCFDGIEYTYNVFEGNEVPAVELMSQTSTDKPNGTEVKVPVKAFDVMEFEQKTLRQLYYFENIVFKGFADRYVTNDYTIVKGKNFLYRGETYSSNMHVCYGKVAYPLDFDAMNMERYEYDIPVAIKIEIGELEGTGVTPSREAIKYTKNNIKIIKDKINLALQEMKDMLSKQYDNVRSIEDYYRSTQNFGNLYFDEDKDKSVYLGRLIKRSDVTYPNFKFKGLTMPDEDELLKKFFNIKLYGKKYPKSRYSYNDRGWDGNLSTMSNFANIYHTDGEFKRKVIKQGYLKTLVTSENFYVVTPRPLDVKDSMTDLLRAFGAIQEIIDLNTDSTSDDIKYKAIIPRKKAEKMIFSMQKDMLKSIIAKSQGDYNEVEVPEDFILARKKKTLSADLLKTTIPVKDMSHYRSRDRVSLKALSNLKGRIYYGFSDDEDQLRNARQIFDNISGRDKKASLWDLRNNTSKGGDGSGTLFIGISKGNEKYMKMLGRKAIHVKGFYKTYITRKVDAIIESKVVKKYDDMIYNDVLDLFYSDHMKHIDLEVHMTATEVREYIKSVKTDHGWAINSFRLKQELGIDIDNVEDNFKFKKEIDQLVRLSDENRNRLKWFDFPHHVDLDKPDHKELIEMVSLMFEK